MPRLTEASRTARRRAIADAALEVFDRRGVAHASTADIIGELGGSAGGVYSHFASKAELVRFIAQGVLGSGIVTTTVEAAPPGSPAAALRSALSEIARDAPFRLIVQLWGEATIDADMRQVVLETLEGIEASLRETVLPWARTLPGDPEARAARAARAMRAVTQGYIVQLALLGATSADRYLDDLVELLAADG